MKKVITFIIVLFLGLVNVKAADINLEICEYSDEYLAWLELDELEKASTKMPEMCKTSGLNQTIIGSSTNYSMSKFSLQDSYVLDVRNQDVSEACWAFSTLASIESNLLKNNISTNYLSVAHMELLTQNSLYTPARKTFNRTFNNGGTFYNAKAYVLNYWGPVNENSLPFTTILDIINNSSSINESSISSLTATVDVDNIFELNNEQGACSTDSINTIKEYLVNYGALAAGIYFTTDTSDLTPVPSSNNTYDIKGKFLNGAYYYYDGSSYTNLSNTTVNANHLSNHAVTIVGWDDEVEINSFTTNSKRKGAWIVKNSYGKSETLEIADGIEVVINLGDEGYYYVSYDDINICTNVMGFYDVDNNLSDNVYYYDYLGNNMSLVSASDTNYIANVFTKKSTNAEKIDKIGFMAANANIDYTVYYASNGSLTNYHEIASGKTTHAGFISVIPDEDIYVTDEFSIIVKFKTEGIIENYIPVAFSSNDISDPYYNYELTKGVSYISLNGTSWADMNELRLNDTTISTQNTIRVYTSNEQKDISSEVDSNEEINDSASSEVTNPNENINTGALGDTTPNNQNNVENPKTGIISGLSIVLVLLIIGTTIYFQKKSKKNKIFKI